MTPRTDPSPASRGLVDSLGRVIRDLRVSVTDRCNFRCFYCLPETDQGLAAQRALWTAPVAGPASHRVIGAWRPRTEILTFEETARVICAAASLGVTKVRLTGGEPLLRRGIEQLVAMVAAIPGVEDLAMTTNGFLFPARARALREAGLQRVNLSLDSLERSMFQRITGRDGLDEVLRSIALARELGFHPLKVNAVIIRGLNDSEVTALAGFARHEEVRMRFIEFMPLDAAHNWSRDMLVPGAEILERLRERFQLTPVASSPSETARRYRFDRGAGELGIIAPVTEPFCGHCNRIRLTADGKLRTCLFSHTEHDLKQVLRDGSSDAGLAQRLRETVLEKEDRHHIGEPIFTPPERTMSCIGG